MPHRRPAQDPFGLAVLTFQSMGRTLGQLTRSRPHLPRNHGNSTLGGSVRLIFVWGGRVGRIRWLVRAADKP